MSESCTCQKCKDCCWHNPGWFATIDEVEGAAKILGKTVEEFCKEYLIREWWSGDDEKTEIPVPRRNMTRKTELAKKYSKYWVDEEIKNDKGFIRASWGHNLMSGYTCIFLTENNLCSIHESKPMECKETFGCRDSDFDRHKLLTYWSKHQDWIENIVKIINPFLAE